MAYSAEDRQSFEAAELWVVMLRELCPGLLLALAHCKSDRPEFCDSVTLAMAKSLAAKPGPQATLGSREPFQGHGRCRMCQDDLASRTQAGNPHVFNECLRLDRFGSAVCPA